MPYSWPPTLTEAKTALNKTGTTDDAELQGALDAAVAILENHPGYRVVDAVKLTSYTEDWTDGGDTILLKHYPVSAVTSVTEYVGGIGTALASEPITTGTFTGYGYRLDAANGIITRLSGGYSQCWLGNVRVVYTAGTSTVPADLRNAVLKLVKHLWDDQRGAATSPFDTSGDEYQAPLTAHLLPWEVEEALQPYRKAPAVA